jgi:FHA domain/Transposase domain (DUF772)
MDMFGKGTSENFLSQVGRLIDWYRLDPLVHEISVRIHSEVPQAAVKMMLLARWYGLSEQALFEACQDRLSFRRFLELPPEDDGADAELAETYRRQVTQAAVEAQNVIHAIEAQLLASGFSIRPGLAAEAAVVPVSSDSVPDDFGEGGDPPAGGDPADFRRHLETSFFQPGEMADLLRQGESAFVRGGAKVASSTNPPHRSAAAELVPLPEREAPPIQAAVEWPWGFTMDLTDRLKVGRDHRFCLFASELQPYLHVSRKHAELMPCPEGVWVRDLKSRNGTFVNDEELPKGQAYLVDSDATIRFGPHCVLQLKIKRS